MLSCSVQICSISSLDKRENVVILPIWLQTVLIRALCKIQTDWAKCHSTKINRNLLRKKLSWVFCGTLAHARHLDGTLTSKSPNSGSLHRDVRGYYLSLAQVRSVKLKLVPNESTCREQWMPSSHSSGCIISFIQEDVSENSCPYYAKYGVFSLFCNYTFLIPYQSFLHIVKKVRFFLLRQRK